MDGDDESWKQKACNGKKKIVDSYEGEAESIAMQNDKAEIIVKDETAAMLFTIMLQQVLQVFGEGFLKRHYGKLRHNKKKKKRKNYTADIKNPNEILLISTVERRLLASREFNLC